MEDNVIDLEARRGRRNGDRSEEVAAERRQRLHAAGEIADALRRTQRTELGDRKILATNLGRMWKTLSKDTAPSLSKLFNLAFGEDGEVQFKKRQRFVRFDNEEADGALNANGRHFAELAEALATMAHEGQPADAIDQARQRAILQLVEGSSFDRRRPPAARLRDKAVATLVDFLGGIVRKIEDHVDLGEMRAAIQNDALAAIIDGDGEVLRLCEFEELSWEMLLGEANSPQRRLVQAIRHRTGAEVTASDMEDWEAVDHLTRRTFPNESPLRIWKSDLDLGNPHIDSGGRVSRMAPRAVLGNVFSPLPPAPVVLLEM